MATFFIKKIKKAISDKEMAFFANDSGLDGTKILVIQDTSLSLKNALIVSKRHYLA